MPAPVANFVTVGEALAGPLEKLMLSALRRAQPILADLRHDADPEVAAALAEIDVALRTAEARP